MSLIRVFLLVFVLIALGLLAASDAAAQETVFNVPSGDVLDRGKVYVELDITHSWKADVSGYTPRIVVGAGHNIELGLNINGIATGSLAQTTPTPTIKWKAYDGGNNGWAFMVGNDLFVPAQNRTYKAGDYSYAEFTKTWTTTRTRATFGGYLFTKHVVASGNRAGGQFAVEQTVNSHLTVAADWYTGFHALGYVTPGMIVKLTPKLTFYGTYQLGNRALSAGNHQMLIEFGYNLRRSMRRRLPATWVGILYATPSAH